MFHSVWVFTEDKAVRFYTYSFYLNDSFYAGFHLASEKEPTKSEIYAKLLETVKQTKYRLIAIKGRVADDVFNETIILSEYFDRINNCFDSFQTLPVIGDSDIVFAKSGKYKLVIKVR